jgi:putative PEP-CTERM system histidine kinase
MATFAIKTSFAGFALVAVTPAEAIYWQRLVFITASFLPGFWLCFSLTYARGNAREFVAKWKFLLLAFFLVPVGIAFDFQSSLLVLTKSESGEMWIALSDSARFLSALILLATVLILSNLEKTFRAAVGTMRWRIKFLIVGVGVIFGARVYTSSQTLLFSSQSSSLIEIESSALIIGCTLIALGYLRSGFAEIDVYPSQAVLQSSATMLIVGGYLFVVGVLAQIVAAMGGVRHFQAQVFLVLIGLVGLTLLLLSDRVRQRRRQFVSRHFRRPEHDFREVWTLFTERTANQFDESGLCSAVAKLICETFNVLSVTIWLVKEGEGELAIGASTSQTSAKGSEEVAKAHPIELFPLPQHSVPFDLESIAQPWAETLREVNPRQFLHGGGRIAVPLLSGQRWLGLAVVADRVSGLAYTAEEFDLLKCIGDQLGASLLNFRLAEENLRAKELEAFQTLSAFFVHDLKNAASGLNLTLQNLRIHFDDPDFRADALRSIASTVDRINSLISRLGVVRGKFEIRPVELDLNQLVTETIAGFNGALGDKVETKLTPLPRLMGDRDQLQSVIQNLLLNAREAGNGEGRIEIATTRKDDAAILTIADNGCGMSEEFLRHSLFRPFHSTKKKGIGIGMFQARAIVHAHRGSIRVESEPQKGSTFRVLLPITTPSES